MTGDARPVGAFLSDPASPIAALFAHADTLRHYQRALQEWQAAGCAAALRVVNLRQGTVVIYADNASALTAVRFRLPELLRHLQAHGCQCTEIEAKVAPRPEQIRNRV